MRKSEGEEKGFPTTESVAACLPACLPADRPTLVVDLMHRYIEGSLRIVSSWIIYTKIPGAC